MGKAYIFYNPQAGQGKVLEDLDALSFVLDEETVLCDMTKPETFEEALFAMAEEDYLVLCGGDGTINRFVNIMADIHRSNEIYYYPAGTHNDFALDYGRIYGNNPFPITKALQRLPCVRIGSREGFFLTGIVFAADPRMRVFSRKRQGYTEESKPVGMKVSVDRRLYHYEKVRFAAVMQGRHCHGGLIPDAQRQRTDSTLSCALIHGCGKCKANYLLRQLRKGRRPCSRHLTIHRAENIRLTFDGPVKLLTDGETQSGVTEVTVRGKETKQ